MEAAPTNTSEPEHQQEKDKEREQNRNFWIAVLQGTFMRISFAFADSTTVLPAFILKLTSSNTLVGLTGSMTRAGWMWPPTPDLESAGTPSAQDALLCPRYELSTARMDRNGRMHPYGRFWQQRSTCRVFFSAVTSSDLRRWESQRFRIWILSPNPLNHIGGLDILVCAS